MNIEQVRKAAGLEPFDQHAARMREQTEGILSAEEIKEGRRQGRTTKMLCEVVAALTSNFSDGVVVLAQTSGDVGDIRNRLRWLCGALSVLVVVDTVRHYERTAHEREGRDMTGVIIFEDHHARR